MLKWIKSLLHKTDNLNDDLKSLKNAKRFLLSNPVLDTGSLSALKIIHFHLFNGIYDHAGKLRRVNFSKGGFHFSDFNDFQEILPRVTAMPETNFENIVDKYTEMNIVHPFCEGNGRTMRIWLDDIFIKRIRLRVDWRHIDKNDYLEAMIQSPYDNSFLKELLAKNMSERVNDKIVIFHGLAQSYIYEIDDSYKNRIYDTENYNINMKL